jgi:hypothetical protein
MEIKVVYPDNETKTFEFVPTPSNPLFEIKTNTKLVCHLSGQFEAKEPDKLFGAFISCHNGAKKNYHRVETLAVCGDSSSVLRVFEGKTNAIEDMKFTVILAKCK